MEPLGLHATLRPPVILLAFANEREDSVQYLRNLPEEHRQLRDALEVPEAHGLCEIVERPNATLSEILRVFQDTRYRDRIALFHFGGHATSLEILLETPAGAAVSVDGEAFASFLGRSKSLQVVFLNGCLTDRHARLLLEHGIPVVVATTQVIEDDVALRFADSFYRSLAAGDTICAAFGVAEAATLMEFKRKLTPLSSCSHLDAQWPWRIYVRPGSEVVGDWSLPKAAGDPLYGLPNVVSGILPECPFRHLEPYDERHAELFFGRRQEIRTLFDRITMPGAAPVLLVYGQSGVGKSSLLGAGVIPRLRSVHDATLVGAERRDNASIPDAHSDWLRHVVDDFIVGWKRREMQTGRPNTLVVDQIERAADPRNLKSGEELRELLETLARTFENRATRPEGKLVLGFRKEWLPEIEQWMADARIERSRFFLQRLNRLGIIEVIEGLGSTERLRARYGLGIETDLAARIADALLRDHASAVAPVLQILLDDMWQAATEVSRSSPVFDEALFTRVSERGLGLSTFLDRQLADLGRWNQGVVEAGLVLDLLWFHTTSRGTSQHRRFTEVVSRYPLSPAFVDELLRQCTDRRLLVESAEELDVNGGTQLAHDTLAPLVRERYEESDRAGQRATRVLENRAVEWRNGNVGRPLDAGDLKVAEVGAQGMRAWTGDEVRLVEASRLFRRSASRRWRALKATLAVMAIAVLVLLTSALRQTKLAKDKERSSRATLAAFYADQKREEDVEAALLLGAVACSLDKNEETVKTLGTVLQGVGRMRAVVRGPISGVPGGAGLSEDGGVVFCGNENGVFRISDFRAHRSAVQRVKCNLRPIRAYRLSPKGDILAALCDNVLEVRRFSGTEATSTILGSHIIRSLGEFVGDGTCILIIDDTGRALVCRSGPSSVRADRLSANPSRVSAVGYSTDRGMVALGFANGDVETWRIEDEAVLVDTRNIGRGPVTQIAIRDNALASTCGQRTVSIWTAMESTSPRMVEVGADTCVTKVWEIVEQRYRKRADARRITQIDLGSDPKIVVTVDIFGETLPYGGGVTVWSLRGSRPESTRVIEREYAKALCFSRDGSAMAFYDTRRDQVCVVALSGYPPVRQVLAEPQDIVSLSFSENGRNLVAGSATGLVSIWHLDLDSKELVTIGKQTKPIERLQFNKGGNLLLSRDVAGFVCLWDLDRVSAFVSLLDYHREAITAMAFCPERRLLATGDRSGKIALWSVSEQSRLVRIINAHAGAIRMLEFESGGGRLFSGARDGVLVSVIDDSTRSAERLAVHASEVTAGCMGAGGGDFVSGDVGGEAYVWHGGTVMEPPRGLHGGSSKITAVLAGVDSDMVLTGDSEGTVRVFNRSGEQGKCGRLDPYCRIDHEREKVRYELMDVEWEGTRPVGVKAMDVSSDKRTFAISYDDDSVVLTDMAGDIPDAAITREGEGDRIRAIGPQGVLAVLRAGSSVDTVVFGSVVTPKVMRRAMEVLGCRVDGRTVCICFELSMEMWRGAGGGALAVSPDSRSVAIGRTDGGLSILDRAGKGGLETIAVGDTSVTALAWNDSGSRLATGHANGSVRITTRAGGGTGPGSVPGGTPVSQMASDRLGRKLAFLLRRGGVAFWNPGGVEEDVSESGGILTSTAVRPGAETKAIVLAAEGRWMVAFGRDSVTVWNDDLDGWRPVKSLSLAGASAYSVGPDKNVVIVNLRRGLRVLRGLEDGDPVWEELDTESEDEEILSFGAHDSLFVSRGTRGSLTLWRVGRHSTIGTQLTPDGGGTTAATLSVDGGLVVAARGDGGLRTWKVQRESVVDQSTRHGRNAVEDAAGSVNIEWLTLGRGGAILSVTADRASGRREIRTMDPTGSSLYERVGGVFTTSTEAIGKWVGVGTLDGTVLLWNRESLAVPHRTLACGENAVTAVRFAPSGTRMGCGLSNGDICVWALRADQGALRLEGRLPGRGYEIRDIILDEEDRLTSFDSGGEVTEWQKDGDEYVGRTLTGHLEPVRCVAFGYDDKVVFTGDQAGRVFCWTLHPEGAAGRILGDHKDPLCSIVPEETGNAIRSADLGGRIELTDWVTGVTRTEEVSHLHSAEVTALAMSGGGEYVATGDAAGKLQVCDLRTPTPRGRTLTSVDRATIQEKGTGFGRAIGAVSFLGGGKKLLAVTAGGEARLWNLGRSAEPPTRLLRGDEGIPRLIIGTSGPGGEMFYASAMREVKAQVSNDATGTRIGFASGEGRASWWKRSGETNELMLTADVGEGVAIAVGDAEREVAGASGSGDIILWDLGFGKDPILKLPGVASGTTKLMILPGSTTAVSGHQDGSVCVWDLSYDSWVRSARGMATRSLIEEELALIR